MAFYGYEDTAGIGVQMEARRKDRKSQFVETWWLEAIPERSFSSFDELRIAAEGLTSEEIAAEASKYPLIRSVKPDSCGNACRLCVTPASYPRAHHDTTRLSVATNWRAATDWCTSLCDDHMQQFATDAAGLLAALKSEVAERKERAARSATTGDRSDGR